MGVCFDERSRAEQSKAKLLELLCAPKVLGPEVARGGRREGGSQTDPVEKLPPVFPQHLGHLANPSGTCAGRPLARNPDGESCLLAVDPATQLGIPSWA